jgi:CRP/FNR family cyclic AMP-dependent transcriptional regulator
MNTNRASFDVLEFLTTKVGTRALSNYLENQLLFSQGDSADSVFYIRNGKVKVTVTSERGK